VVRLAANANVLLAAVLGGRSRLILDSPKIEQVFTAEPTMTEVRQYVSVLARKRRLPADLVLLAVASLPVTIVRASDYAASMAEARRRIGRRDPDDIPILALAIELGIPIWSNDKDFEESGVSWFSTGDLLHKLGILHQR
jgi:predicted nucleic acid-binding protein